MARCPFSWPPPENCQDEEQELENLKVEETENSGKNAKTQKVKPKIDLKQEKNVQGYSKSLQPYSKVE